MADDKEKEFSLDNMAMLWEERKRRHERYREDKKWLDEFNATLKTIAGEAQVFTLGRRKVARLVPGQLNESKLSKEQPEIIDQFTRRVTERRFDAGAFREEMPEIYARYQAQRLVMVDEPAAIEGIG